MELAYCGLNCDECPIYTATINNDDDLRKEVTEKYFQMTKVKVELEDINCLGCKSQSGVEFYHCDECKIRNCAMTKNKTNCALCEEYNTCPTLNVFLEQYPPVRDNLEEVRNRIKQ
jgi:hypothetical protein